MTMVQKKDTAFARLDSVWHSMQGRMTLNISPVSQLLAFYDWAANLADSPGKKVELMEASGKALSKFWENSFRYMLDPKGAALDGPARDPRFRGELWQQWPYNFLADAFRMTETWWLGATSNLPGVSPHNEQVVSFMTKQALDIFSPTNYLWTNPEIMKVTVEQQGMNLVRGLANFLEDTKRVLTGQRPVGLESFKVGETLAATPGKVVFRNRLIELIQYQPSTPDVHAEPVLIVPAWIMKYYILDLSARNSLAKFLVDKGHTVFMVSWKNPDEGDRDMGMEEYRTLGVMDALDAVSAIVPGRRIHTVGYCLGGTILSIAAATMARERDDRLRSMTLLAAQTDFTEAGEIMVFIDENQVNYLEDIMASKGYLDTKEMAGAFQMLRSYDLFWSHIIHDYLMGERTPMIDLMAWNSDATRMPYKMHAEYLRRLFLNNDFFEGRFKVGGRNIVISDIHVPVFIVGTVQDHVAPWRSVYKFLLSTDAEEVTFVLTSGGHNAGIVSEPTHPRRTHQISTRREGDMYIDPDTWQKETAVSKGSWWVPWEEWLSKHSSGRAAPPSMGAPDKGYAPLGNAPGTYVLQD
jgi:polyhydroxyalkanoate synthase